jgi:ribosomal protein L12E/L44/L45/RPP1/RPP2
MSDTQVTVQGLVQQCIDADAANAADTLNALLGPKIVDAIQAKKVEVARSLYGAPEESQDASSSDNEEQQTASADQEEEHENA